MSESENKRIEYKLEINIDSFKRLSNEMRVVGIRTIKECVKALKTIDQYKGIDSDKMESELFTKLDPILQVNW